MFTVIKLYFVISSFESSVMCSRGDNVCQIQCFINCQTGKEVVKGRKFSGGKTYQDGVPGRNAGLRDEPGVALLPRAGAQDEPP